MRWIISAVVALALVAGLWWMEQRQQAERAPEPEMALPDPADQPEPRYPLPEADPQPARPDEAPENEVANGGTGDPSGSGAAPEPQPTLPQLSESDPAVLDELSGLVGSDWVEEWIRPEFVISRTVAIVNSLDGAAPALKAWPLNALDSDPITRQTEEALLWTEANSERYAGLVTALESVQPEAAAAHYARYYPLFQQAWDELGETEPYFNDRLIDIIDHLLATPNVDLPFEVIAYEGRLHFADEALQETSWGRKLMIRIGPGNAAVVKSWLRAFRRGASGTDRTPVDDTDGAFDPD